MALSWKEAVIQVLNEAGEPLHYQEITDRILAQELTQTKGATPAATVSATINDSIKKDPHSPFMRVRTGEYMLKETEKKLQKQDDETEKAITPFRAYGMYWEKAKVKWQGRTALWGKQGDQADKVDFAGQVGVYILYDGHRPIYAGRALTDSLGVRLQSHTKGRMAGRWTRFSWFGFRGVSKDGSLQAQPERLDTEQVIIAMESLLIEVMEAPLNMKVGDAIRGFEFLQDEAPELAQDKLMQQVLQLMKGQK